MSRNASSQNHTEGCRSHIEDALIREGGAKAKRIKIGLDRFEEHRKNKRAHNAQDPQEHDPMGEKHPTRTKHSDVPGNKETEAATTMTQILSMRSIPANSKCLKSPTRLEPVVDRQCSSRSREIWASGV